MAGKRVARESQGGEPEAAAPPARRPSRSATAPPRDREASAAVLPTLPTTSTRGFMDFNIAHTLRSRKVFVPAATKRTYHPLQYKKGKEPVYDSSWQTPACAKVALEHYNRINEDEYELVKAVDSVAFVFNGLWMHANFLAKLKGATSCVDLVPKYFFAELYIGPDGMDAMSCVSCVRIEPGNPEAAPVRGCEVCRIDRVYHPATGGHRGDRKSVR